MSNFRIGKNDDWAELTSIHSSGVEKEHGLVRGDAGAAPTVGSTVFELLLVGG